MKRQNGFVHPIDSIQFDSSDNGSCLTSKNVVIPCKISESEYFHKGTQPDSMDKSSETNSRQLEIINHLKEKLHREEAALLLLQKLRLSQIRRSMANERQQQHQQQQTSVQNTPKHQNNKVPDNHTTSSNKHTPAPLNTKSSKSMINGTSEHRLNNVNSHKTNVSKNNSTNSSNQQFAQRPFNHNSNNQNYNNNDNPTRKAHLRHDIQKAIEQFMQFIRSQKKSQQKTKGTFMPTNPIEFIPCANNHEFTMLIGLEQVCRAIRSRMASTATEPTPQKLNKCSKCNTFNSPYFFTLKQSSKICCMNCFRSLRIEQLSKDQLRNMERLMSGHKETKAVVSSQSMFPQTTLDPEQLRLCHNEWIRQAALLSSSASNPFGASQAFLSNAMAAAAAFAAMTASANTNIAKIPNFKQSSNQSQTNTAECNDGGGDALNLTMRRSKE